MYASHHASRAPSGLRPLLNVSGPIGLAAVLLLGACPKDNAVPPTSAPAQTVAPAPAGPPGTAAAPRRVDVRVSNQGYTPGRINGKPGETLQLSFHYEASAGECGREVLLPGGEKLTLEAGKEALAKVVLPPNKGELTFTCGMNMLRGTLVAE